VNLISPQTTKVRVTGDTTIAGGVAGGRDWE
jgi:hypothetical protein